MHVARGNCGHLNAKWDNHPSCISCTACLRVSPCSICSICTIKSVESCRKEMTICHSQVSHDTEKKTEESKMTKKSQSDLSDNGSFDGSTVPLSYTARGRTHQGCSQGDLESDRALSPPVTGSTSHQATNHWSSSHRSSSHWSTTHRSSTHWSASHQSSSHWSTRHRSTRHYLPVIRIWLSKSIYSWLFTSQCASTKLCSFYKQPCISR